MNLNFPQFDVLFPQMKQVLEKEDQVLQNQSTLSQNDQQLLLILRQLDRKVDMLMATLQDVLSQVQSEKQDIADAAGRIADLETQLQGAIAAGDQATIDQIFASIADERESIQTLAQKPTPPVEPTPPTA